MGTLAMRCWIGFGAALFCVTLYASVAACDGSADDPAGDGDADRDCATNPTQTGCPCDAGQVLACYTGPPGTAGQGHCRAGLRECAVGGTWGQCEGQRLPADGCGGADGLAVDADGRPWIGSSTSRFDIENEVWERTVDANGNPFHVSGTGIAIDAAGNAYTGRFGEAYRIDGETLEVSPLPGMGGHCWSVDADGFVWAVDTHQDAALVMDPQTLEVTTVRPPFVAPSTISSNMTTVAYPVGGVYTHSFEACPPLQQVHLIALAWDAEFPEGSTAIFRIKHALSLEMLEEVAWIDVGTAPGASTPVDLDAVLSAAGVDTDHLGRYVRIEVTLLGLGGREGPTLSSITLRHTCG